MRRRRRRTGSWSRRRSGCLPPGSTACSFESVGRARAEGDPGADGGIRGCVGRGSRTSRRVSAVGRCPTLCGRRRGSRTSDARRSGARGAVAQRRAVGSRQRGAGVGRAGYREEPPVVALRARREWGWVRGLWGACSARSWRCRTSRGSRSARSSSSTRRSIVLERHVAAPRRRARATGWRPARRRVPGRPSRQSSDPETERFLLFKAVAERTRRSGGVGARCRRARRLPLGGWAVGGAAQARRAQSVEHGALQLIVTYRDSDLTKDHPLSAVLADLRRRRRCRADRAEGLRTRPRCPGDGGGRRPRTRCGRTDRSPAEIASETDGNPFFVGEILRSLSSPGRLLYDEATATVERRPHPAARPARERARGDRAPRRPARRRGARGADAGGGDRSLVRPRAARATGRPRPRATLLDQLEAAVTASLLDESTDRRRPLPFVHALINHTLYEGLGGTRRLEHAPPRREPSSAVRHELDETCRGAGAALAAGDRATDKPEGGEVFSARRPAWRSTASRRRGREAVHRCARAARRGRGCRALRALIGLGEAQR